MEYGKITYTFTNNRIPVVASDMGTSGYSKDVMESRLYVRTLNSSIALRNGLILLLNRTFPGANKILSLENRTASANVKWADSVRHFWHKDSVTALSLYSFAVSSPKWCKRTGYHFGLADAEKTCSITRNAVATLPKNSTKLLITQAVDSLNTVYVTLQVLRDEMLRLAAMLPDFEIVMSMHGSGKTPRPWLMAEIGDVHRFTHKCSLVAFTGIDAPLFQSGDLNSQNRHVSKRGSPHLRRVLFTISSVILQNEKQDDPVFRFMDKKQAEVKHFYVYIVAGATIFLRIYYALVKEYSDVLAADIAELV